MATSKRPKTRKAKAHSDRARKKPAVRGAKSKEGIRRAAPKTAGGLDEELRRELGRPMGPVMDEETAVRRAARSREGPLIAIGDETVHRLLTHGIRPDVIVVDFITRRAPLARGRRGELERAMAGYRTLRARNPPGTITPSLMQGAKDSLESLPSALIVEGEEDLATLVYAHLAPKGSLILYGQPDAGIVAYDPQQYGALAHRAWSKLAGQR